MCDVSEVYEIMSSLFLLMNKGNAGFIILLYFWEVIEILGGETKLVEAKYQGVSLKITLLNLPSSCLCLLGASYQSNMK